MLSRTRAGFLKISTALITLSRARRFLRMNLGSFNDSCNFALGLV
jgi:hypothetical protein